MIHIGRKAADLRWSNEEPEKAHETLTNAIDVIDNRPSNVDRAKQHLLYASLYGNLPVLGFGINSYSRYASATRIALNVTQNAIDALVSKVTKDKPKPTFATVEGDYEKREKAELQGKFVNGQFYSSGYYDIAPAVALDCCVYGTGPIKTYERYEKPALDRTFPWELRIDDREALYGHPRNLYQRKYYDKLVLIEQWVNDNKSLDEGQKDELRRIIESGGKDNNSEDFDYDESSDQIRVYEGWHLRSGPNAKDGRHIIAVRGATLLFEDYEEDDFPFSFLRPMRQPMGFWGIGICEKLAGIQGEINRIVRDIQAAMHLLAKPHWMVENSSKVALQHLNNDIATIIKYTGAVPPAVYVPQAMTAEVYQHLQFLYHTAYELTGISQLTASGQKPAGLNSGEAQRVHRDMQTERFADFVTAYGDLAKDVALKQLASARRIAKKNKNYAVKALDKGSFSYVKFLDADLGDDAVIQIFPTNKLPDEPEGQIAFVEQMTQAKMMDPEDAFELIDFPDIRAYKKRRGAARKNIERDIGKMRKGEAIVVEPIGNLALRLKLVTEGYEEAKHDGLPEERLALFRKHLTATNDYINKQKPLVPPPPMPPPGLSPGMPMPAPVDPMAAPLPGGPIPMPPPGPPMPPGAMNGPV